MRVVSPRRRGSQKGQGAWFPENLVEPSGREATADQEDLLQTAVRVKTAFLFMTA